MTALSFFSPANKIISTTCKIVVGLSVLLAVFSSSAALFFTDQFAYTDGVNLGATTGGGGATWTLASGDVTQIKVANASTQTSPSGYAPAAGLGVTVTTTTSRKTTGVPFNGATGIPVTDGNIVYASFLLNIRTLPSSGNMRVAYLNNVAASSSAALEVWVSSAGQLGVSKKGGTIVFVSGTPFSSIGTHLVVIRYTFQSGADEVAMWVDPVSGSYGLNPAPTTGTYTNTILTSDYTSTILYFIIASEAITGPVFWIDEVRVATTWAEVTPSGNPTTPASGPVITQTLLVPQGLILRGTNGSPSSAYQVLASTNLSWPASNWPSIAAHAFDLSGNFDSTNPVTPGLAQQFFRLLVGDTNPPAASAPSITNQPQSLALAIGATANFLVGASGTAPLSYFWSFNTNTSVGGNSSTLALLNVQTNDAGSYRVIVSNSVGSATSSVATLTVLIPPAITASPTNLAVISGGSAAFSVTAAGSATLRYQWFFNTNTVLANATNATFTLNPVNATNAGTYSVIVTNSVGSVTSSVALLTVSSAPVITAQPQDQSVTVSNDATFTVTAAGTAPLAYQWFFNTNTLVGGNSNSLTRINAQATSAGTYSVIITNNYGAVTSAFATLTVSTAAVNNAQFNLAGFAYTTTGGGIIAESSAAYRKVTNALDLANAIDTSSVKVIEVMTNLDLGWLEIGAAAQAVGPFRQHATPSLHPRLIQTGVSLMDIQSRDGLTIFSTNGATIKHCCFNIKNARNIIIRNLKFDEMWEWDEATKGNYDNKDWDFIDLGNGGGTGTTTNIWIDHCTFTKAYDGICDIKGGANHITFSWNRYVGDDSATNTNSFVWQQINTLESNKTAYAMYNSLRTSSGFTPAEIVSIIQGHDKTHLAGANSGVGNAGNAAENALISITFHHQWFQNCWDRCVPRLRGGNVHSFNIYADDSLALDAKRLRDAHGVNSSYSFNPVLNGSIATESGAILVENSIYQDCLTPLRNNQTDTNNPAYTGKIMALNSIYSFRTTGGTTNNYNGSSTNAPGDTNFGPVQAPTIPFAWNGFTTLPYSYTNVLNDPAQLQAILTSSAGAGAMTWAKSNWLKTAY